MAVETRDQKQADYILDGEILTIGGSMTLISVQEFLDYVERAFRNYRSTTLTIRLDSLQEADTAGISAIHYIHEKLKKRGIEVKIDGPPTEIQQQLSTLYDEQIFATSNGKNRGFMERIGRNMSRVFREYIRSYISIAAEITYWSMVDLFKKKTHRKGEVVNQAVLMGVNAALIVGAMSFIIGLVLALQSAAQLRAFGANIYIVDLTVIAMMSEMGPLITAIMVAGRSGSAIAAELATMKVTSETDALRTMGLNPVRFVMVPKMHAGILTMPFLTILADITGILGGMLIAASILDISPLVFLNRMEQSLLLKDIIFGIIKSLVFIYLIVITGSYFGTQSDKGASEVGKVTTSAVVVSISLVIVADSIMGLLIY
jgi:phospholipid/cholesterol/gamma-HCH transport system permease protein